MAEVRLEIDLAHPSERVWRALTDARVLRDWFMPTDLEPRQGGRFTFEPGTLPGFLGPVSGELLELIPQHRLVMLWQGENLYTRVLWELTGTGGSCRLLLVQSGFIGAPAALRSRTLRATYRHLFGQRLPGVLERLAGAGPGEHAITRARETDPQAAAGLRAAVPAPRRRNAAVAAWSAGRVLGGAVDPAGEVVSPPHTGAATPRARIPAPRAPADLARSPAGEVTPAGVAPARLSRAGGSRSRARRGSQLIRVRRWLAMVPPWVRGSAAAALSVVAALVLVSASGPGGYGQGGPGGGEEQRNPPGVAMQPGLPASTATAAAGGRHGGGGPLVDTPVPGSHASRPTGPLSESGGSAQPGPIGLSGVASTPRFSPSASPMPRPELTAVMRTSGLPLLGGRSVEVTITNPGPGEAGSWELVTELGEQPVTNVTGASYQRDGALAIFTALAGLPEEATTVVRFDLRPPLLGLVGASAPTSCTIDGRPCD